MAEEKEKPGLLAILGVGKKGADDDDGEPKSEKARAVKAMFEAAEKGDWDEVAEEFGRAYDLCMMGEGETEDEDEGDQPEEL
jgi:hypothetical protein